MEGPAVIFEKPKSQEETTHEKRENEQHEFARRQVETNERLASFTFVLMLATVFAMVVAIWQGTISQRTANAAKSAADTADKTLQHIIANDAASSASSLAKFKEEERAYVAPSYAVMSNPPNCLVNGEPRIYVDIHFVNSGRTPALGVQLIRYATFGDRAEETIRRMKVPPYSYSKGNMLGNVGDRWGTAPTGPVDSDTTQKLINGQLVVYIFGVIQYLDIFKQYHETGFCYQRIPNNTPFGDCEYGNWFDKRPNYEQKRTK